MKEFIFNLASDIKNISLFFLANKSNTVCFFNENKNTLQYLEYYLRKKEKKLFFFHYKKLIITLIKILK